MPDRTKQQHIISHLQGQYGYFFAKRCADVLFSLFLMAVLYPWLMPVLALLIKLDSKGPIFFRQKRTGYLGKIFTCTKLRTMVVNEEADSRQATEDDPRITRIGMFLRKTGLDELPQFISVLKGDMSLIGPRPHMIQDTEHFSSRVKDYNLRHLVRPGITGMAQIKGYRGATESPESIYRRYQWDAYYVRNTSWKLDVKILSGTIRLTAQYIIGTGPSAAGQDITSAGPRLTLLGQDITLQGQDMEGTHPGKKPAHPQVIFVKSAREATERAV
jgi:putative colanic acid biosynthesis UDP-glucose lipid carrier transferase